MAECPTCGDAFKNTHGMRIHHVQAHDDSIAGEELTCEQCGDTFYVQRDKVDKRRFCSRECSDNWRSDTFCGEAHHNYNRMTVECDNCNEDVTRPLSVIEETERTFCSRECQYEFLGELYSERRTGDSNPMYGRCGEDHPNWNGGYEPHNYGVGWQQQRRKALQRDEHQCQDCGMTQAEHREMYGSDLEVHHKTPFRTFEDTAEANQLDNLITVCKSCHRKRDKDYET